MGWVGSWASTPAPVEDASIANQTLRMIAHLSIGGQRLRVRLSNAYGLRKLDVGAARVGLRDRAATVVPGSDRRLTFGGSASISIPAGALVISDPVELEVAALADLAISCYLPGSVPASFRITGHANAHQTNYISTPGDFTTACELPVQQLTTAFLFLTSVDVLAPVEAGGIVTMGDSLTDCNLSKLDANNRWPDELARRLMASPGGRPMGVMNQGLGGNRILHDGRGDSGLRRFDRDVLAQTGVSHVVVLLGINDIRNRNGLPDEVVNAEDIICGLKRMIARARARDLTIFGGTLLTFEHETFNPGFYTLEGEAKRQAVNAWIRESDEFDAVIDFEAALRDPAHPTQMLASYDCGDHLHPSDLGYLRMGQCVDLDLFN